MLEIVSQFTLAINEQGLTVRTSNMRIRLPDRWPKGDIGEMLEKQKLIPEVPVGYRRRSILLLEQVIAKQICGMIVDEECSINEPVADSPIVVE